MACDSPVALVVKGQDILVPCNRCYNCIMRRVNEWVFRLQKEEERSIASHFVTLTYDTQHVPLTKEGMMSLRKSDLQKFFKRLRKNTGSDSIKYFAVGEYGSKTHRPHYHAIIFNVIDPEQYFKAWSLDGTHFGIVDVGTVTSASIAYTLKYMEKDSFRQKRKRYRHARDSRELEFAVMSKRLGSNYLDNPSVVNFHRRGYGNNYVVRDGFKTPLPRYYRKQMFDDDFLEAQREHICRVVAEMQEKERSLFVPSRSFPTLADRLESKREYDKQRLYDSRNRRNKV